MLHPDSPVGIPSFHVIGDTDKIIPPERSDLYVTIAGGGRGGVCACPQR